MKKFLWSIVVMVLLFFVAPIPTVSAAEGDTTWQENYEYNIDQNAGTIKLYRLNSDVSGNIVVPAYAVKDGVRYDTYVSMSVFWGSGVQSISFEKGVKACSDISHLFYLCKAKTIDLSGLDTSCVTNMNEMFWKCQAQSLDLSGFDTSNVTNMSAMFSGCSSLTSLDVSRFNTSNVTN
ncbi:MAG: DUF285 domain-containing protein, partial [Lachnospiraceae bacterium]|nr:DUF285 domain-containing protein [Lachnospiraceae bacterium]